MLRDNQQFNESIKSNSAFLDELRQKMPEFLLLANMMKKATWLNLLPLTMKNSNKL
ncbi:hypothetical protein I131_07890 [Enterococcus faecium CRL1879]|nr:hypothetical protein I131_07890 [Enterococcus faecium CRL1879]